MDNQERDVIDGIFKRLEQAANQPRDPEAERYIAGKIQAQPYAPYAMAQSLYVQEQALINLQAENERLKKEHQQPQQGGFLSSLFGGGSPATGRDPSSLPNAQPSMGGRSSVPPTGASYNSASLQASPMPSNVMPSNPMPGSPWGGQSAGGGGGFLKTAVTTAAGVAGGMMVANALSSAFSGHHNAAAASTTPETASDHGFYDTANSDDDSDDRDSSYDASDDFDSGSDSGGDWA